MPPVSILDVTGFTCPIPLLRTKKELRNLSVGEILKVITTDPQTENDIKRFSLRGKCKIIDFSKMADRYIFKLVKT